MDYLESKLQDFELEFCLRLPVFLKAFPDEEWLWRKEHARHVSLFHELFTNHKGKKQIAEDIAMIIFSITKSRNGYETWFDKQEFSNRERRFIVSRIRAFKERWLDIY